MIGSETMLHAIGLLVIIATFVSSQSQTHHKVRHKHNLLGVRGNHVNEIREAFDQYRNVMHKNKLKDYPDDDDQTDNNLRLSSWTAAKLNEKSRRPRTNLNRERKVNNAETSPSAHFLRNKRVFMTTTTTTTKRPVIPKSIDYGDDYEDDDNDTDNRRLNDDAAAAQVSSSRFNRDSYDRVNQLAADEESLTDFKMKTLGTMDDVHSSFQREMMNNGQDVHHHIRQNILRTKQDGMCRWPNKKVVEMPQQAIKMYTPRKYVIYKCSDETACCGSSDKTCVAKQSKELVLWFHVRFVDSTGVEPLKIMNDTECECIYKDRTGLARPTRSPFTLTTTTKAPLCRCPSDFDSEIDDGTCGCVCRDSSTSDNMCRLRYEGKEGFTMSDQRCILTNDCVQPHCLHGIYSRNNGRCPDKNDKINKGFQGSRTARRLR